MRAHINYLRYVLRHKWYVFLECCKAGIPLLGIIHDISKFFPAEWSPYVHTFYNKDGSFKNRRDESGYYDPKGISERFDRAWLHHQHCNKHHWQHWYLVNDTDGEYCLEIPERYLKEMLCDWYGAGKAKTGKDNTEEWYSSNADKMKLHKRTRLWIERQLRKGQL